MGGKKYQRRVRKVQQRLVQCLPQFVGMPNGPLSLLPRRILADRSRMRQPQKCKLGIGCAKLREDMCPVCHAYDHVLLPKMRVWLTHVHSAMKHKDASYWSGFAAADDMISETFQSQLRRCLSS